MVKVLIFLHLFHFPDYQVCCLNHSQFVNMKFLLYFCYFEISLSADARFFEVDLQHFPLSIWPLASIDSSNLPIIASFESEVLYYTTYVDTDLLSLQWNTVFCFWNKFLKIVQCIFDLFFYLVFNLKDTFLDFWHWFSFIDVIWLITLIIYWCKTVPTLQVLTLSQWFMWFINKFKWWRTN